MEAEGLLQGSEVAASNVSSVANDDGMMKGVKGPADDDGEMRSSKIPREVRLPYCFSIVVGLYLVFCRE